MKKLVIAEKPSVGRDIARVLGCKQQGKKYIEGNEYIVTWGLGHLVTLADPEGYDKKLKTWRMEDLPMMPERFKLVVIPQTRGQFQAVKSLIERKDVGEIIIATDAGREGELVARWILAKAGNKKPLKRLWISSVTDKAIREGFAHLKNAKEYENLYHAATARAESDWLVGMNATRALTCKYNAQLSCGRVQTPTLAMIAAREEEIRHFTPKPYYGLQLIGKGITFTWKDKKSGSAATFSREKNEEVYKKILGKTAEVTEVKKTKKTSQPEGLYDLTDLSRDANQRFGFSAKQTLNIMQSLYEHHKVLTYPRTDSRYLTTDVAETLRERVEAIAVGPYRSFTNTVLKGKITPKKSFVNNQKVSDHHAIIPTEQPVILAQLSVDERKIFDLVVRRFLAVLYPPYEYEQTKITIQCEGETFFAEGNVPLNRGYKEVTVPEDLKKPELTAEWESRLSAIAKGKASDRKFMKEIETYTKELMKQIQNGTGTFRHDNLTNKVCPECGKRLLLVNGKQGKLYVCQDRECGYKERISRMTNARCPVCHKKMELIGAKENQKFVCSCGHKESMQAFENRRKKEGAGVSKKDVANYMKKMKKEEKQPLNNALADALANLKL